MFKMRLFLLFLAVFCISEISHAQNLEISSDSIYTIEDLRDDLLAIKEREEWGDKGKELKSLAKNQGGELTRFLSEMLDHPDSNVKLNVIYVLFFTYDSIEWPTIAPKIIKLLDNESPQFQIWAFRALTSYGNFEEEKRISFISERLDSKNKDLQENVIGALVASSRSCERKSVPFIPNDEITLKLIKILKDKTLPIQTRNSAMHLLRHTIITDKELSKELHEEKIQLLSALLDEEEGIASDALDELNEMDSDLEFIAPKLFSLLKKGSSRFKTQIIYVLRRKIKNLPEEILQNLENITTDSSDEYLLEQATLCLAIHQGKKSVFDILIKRLIKETKSKNIFASQSLLKSLRTLNPDAPEIVSYLTTQFLSEDNPIEIRWAYAEVLTFAKFENYKMSDDERIKILHTIDQLLNQEPGRKMRIILAQLREQMRSDIENYSLDRDQIKNIFHEIEKEMKERLSRFGPKGWFFGNDRPELASLSLGIILHYVSSDFNLSQEELEKIITAFLNLSENFLEGNADKFEGYPDYSYSYAILAFDCLIKNNSLPEKQIKIATLSNQFKQQVINNKGISYPYNTHAAATAIIAVALTSNLTEPEKESLLSTLDKSLIENFPTMTEYSSGNIYLPFVMSSRHDSRGAACRSVLVQLARWILKQDSQSREELILSIKNFSHFLYTVDQETSRDGSWHGDLSALGSHYYYPSILFITSAVHFISQSSDIAFDNDVNLLWRSLRGKIFNNYFMAFFETPEQAKAMDINDGSHQGLAFANFSGALSLLALDGQNDWLNLKRFNH